MVELVVTAGAISRSKLQSNHRQQQTNTQVFLQAGCPSCRPTNSVKALSPSLHFNGLFQVNLVQPVFIEAKDDGSGGDMDFLTPSSPGGLPTLSLTTKSSW